MNTWPIAMRYGSDADVAAGEVLVGPDNGWHHGWLADAHDGVPNKYGLLPVYKGRSR